MSKSPRNALPPGSGLFNGISFQVRLIARLMADSRVSPLIKILPAFSLLYMVFPDLLPGPIDDAALLWVGTYLFEELCPPDVVEEHRRKLAGEPLNDEPPAPPPPSSQSGRPPRDDVIDAEYRDLD